MKTLEEIRLEEIQAEAAAYYSCYGKNFAYLFLDMFAVVVGYDTIAVGYDTIF